MLILRLIKKNKNLTLILALAILLRIIGILHGYPYIFNIDEPAIVRSSLGLLFSPSIDHFDWPHFSYYFHFLFYFLFIKLRGLIQIINLDVILKPIFPILWNDPFVFYLISRLITALFGAFTVIPIYMLGKSMFSRKVGLIAALFLAVYPFHVYLSHFTMQDVTLLFWISWAIYFAYKSSIEFSIKNFIITGIFIGLSSSIKYNAGIIGLILPLFIILNFKNLRREISLKRAFIYMLISGMISLITFLLLNHRIILDWDLFWSYEHGRGFLWQLNENSVPLSLHEYAPHLFINTRTLILDSGYTIFSLFLFSIIFIKKTKKSKLIVTMYLFGLINILLISRYGRSTSHYYISVYPFIILLASFSYIKIREIFTGKYFPLLIFMPIIFVNFLFFGKLIKHDARFIAYETAQNIGDDIYYNGNSIGEFNSINNLGIKKYKDDIPASNPNSIIISETIIEDENIRLVKFVSSINRNGNRIYVYKKN